MTRMIVTAIVADRARISVRNDFVDIRKSTFLLGLRAIRLSVAAGSEGVNCEVQRAEMGHAQILG
jgi:hypothetical protein